MAWWGSGSGAAQVMCCPVDRALVVERRRAHLQPWGQERGALRLPGVAEAGVWRGGRRRAPRWPQETAGRRRSSLSAVLEVPKGSTRPLACKWAGIRTIPSPQHPRAAPGLSRSFWASVASGAGRRGSGGRCRGSGARPGWCRWSGGPGGATASSWSRKVARRSCPACRRSGRVSQGPRPSSQAWGLPSACNEPSRPAAPGGCGGWGCGGGRIVLWRAGTVA